MASPLHRPGINRQRGVALFFALIILVILLIGGVMVIHSVNTSLLGAGNLAFRRDLVTQSDAVVAEAMQAVSTGAIPDLTNNSPSHYYYASIQPANAQGIPTTLFTTGTAGMTTGQNHDIAIRYVIERMCSATGPVTAAHCVQTPGKSDNSGSDIKLYHPPPVLPGNVIYRLSARVSGPRGTEAFFQTLFSGPN